MPVYQITADGRQQSFSQDARFVENIERDLHRDLMAVASDARSLIEMGVEVAREGETYDLTSDLRKTIADTMSALTDLHEALPKPKLRVVS